MIQRNWFWLFFCIFSLALMLGYSPEFQFGAKAKAQAGQQMSFIRDAEIEHYIRELATPVYRAADVNPDDVNVVIVKSNTINAFVAGGQNEFFYTGLLQLTDTPEQLLGVIAHETGHIAGGHLARGTEAMRNATAEAILGTIIAVAAGIASGNGQAAVGALGGAQDIAERNFLSFSRTQEGTADAAGLSYLDKIGITSRGMLEFMQKLSGQELLPIDRQSEYVRTHPLTQDRITAIEHHLQTSSFADAKLDPKFQAMHERMKAKLLGFLQPETALLRSTDKDPRISVRYSRAVAFYLTNQLPRAISLVDGLLQEEPKNPYFYELKAQMLFENNRVEDAVGLYQKSAELAPNSGLLRAAYGHALIESKDPTRIDLAIQQLQEANRIEPHESDTWRLLASAWGRKAELTKDQQFEGMVSYALAEEALARGSDGEAKQLAERALKILAKGSPYWVKAQDIKLSTESDRKH